jgi:endonuclease/exonuclease/phosphatase family metal-dependent hydrolase
MKRCKVIGCLLMLMSMLLFFNCSYLNRPAPLSTALQAKNYTNLQAGNYANPDSDTKLRVATYNVHMQSAKAIVEAIQANPNLRRVDVLLLQEIEDNSASQAEEVARRLNMNYAYAPGYGLADGGSHGVAIISRHELKDLEIIELPYFHVVVNSARRVALGATIELNRAKVRIYSVHLDNRINPSKRKKQLAPVFDAAAQFEGPVVIGGDLNTSPFCWGLALIPVPCGLQDNATENSAKAAGFTTPLAEAGATAKWLSMKLDAIYVRDLQTNSRAVEESVRLSDHLPVWLDVSLPTKLLSQNRRR